MMASTSKPAPFSHLDAMSVEEQHSRCSFHEWMRADVGPM